MSYIEKLVEFADTQYTNDVSKDSITTCAFKATNGRYRRHVYIRLTSHRLAITDTDTEEHVPFHLIHEFHTRSLFEIHVLVCVVSATRARSYAYKLMSFVCSTAVDAQQLCNEFKHMKESRGIPGRQLQFQKRSRRVGENENASLETQVFNSLMSMDMSNKRRLDNADLYTNTSFVPDDDDEHYGFRGNTKRIPHNNMLDREDPVDEMNAISYYNHVDEMNAISYDRDHHPRTEQKDDILTHAQSTPVPIYRYVDLTYLPIAKFPSQTARFKRCTRFAKNRKQKAGSLRFVEKKVSCIGTYDPVQEVSEKIILEVTKHAADISGVKARLQLSINGLMLLVNNSHSHDERHVPFDKIRNFHMHIMPENPIYLICSIQERGKPKTKCGKLIVCTCSSINEAKEIVMTFKNIQSECFRGMVSEPGRIIQKSDTVPTLQSACRDAIMWFVRESDVKRLPLPPRLKRFLCYQTEEMIEYDNPRFLPYRSFSMPAKTCFCGGLDKCP